MSVAYGTLDEYRHVRNRVQDACLRQDSHKREVGDASTPVHVCVCVSACGDEQWDVLGATRRAPTCARRDGGRFEWVKMGESGCSRRGKDAAVSRGG